MSAGSGAPTAGLNPTDAGAVNQMQNVYNEATKFEAAVTQVTVQGQSSLDAAKQRPQQG